MARVRSKTSMMKKKISELSRGSEESKSELNKLTQMHIPEQDDEEDSDERAADSFYTSKETIANRSDYEEQIQAASNILMVKF